MSQSSSSKKQNTWLHANSASWAITSSSTSKSSKVFSNFVSYAKAQKDIARAHRKSYNPQHPPNDPTCENPPPTSTRTTRDLIRYLYLVIDLSVDGMSPPTEPGSSDPYFRPSRIASLQSSLNEFIPTYFDQNPVSYLGVIVMRSGGAELLSKGLVAGGAQAALLNRLNKCLDLGGESCVGEMSVWKGLEVAGRSLEQTPIHGSKEVLLLTGSLRSTDKRDIFRELIPVLQAARIRVSCISVAGAEVFLLRRLVELCGGGGGDSRLECAMDRNHLTDLLVKKAKPPVKKKSLRMDGEGWGEGDPNPNPNPKTCSFVQYGFPLLLNSSIPTMTSYALSKSGAPTVGFSTTSYECPRCKARVKDVPCDCTTCGLKLIIAPMLSRSFHHLFPVPGFDELDEDEEDENEDTATKCFACSRVFITNAELGLDQKKKKKKRIMMKATSIEEMGDKSSRAATASEVVKTMKFKCTKCREVFCFSCDMFLHETLHNCPGCLLLPR